MAGGPSISYAELDRRSTRLAQHLVGLGVGPDRLVGLCADRSLAMMVGLLGILKAGGAYVPLDPAYPKERLAFMLEDAQVPVLLTQDRLQRDFNFQNPNLELYCLDARRLTHPARRRTARPSNLHPQSSTTLAYVLYTSGSTGKPKGVMVTHRNVASFFAAMDRVLGTNPGVWLALTSISFDISVLELFWTLARGFKVVIQPDEERARPVAAGVSPAVEGGILPPGPASEPSRELFKPGPTPPRGTPGFTAGATPAATVPEQILQHGVTHMQCTPSLARALVLAPEALQAMRQLNFLLLGGEPLPVVLAQQLRRVVPCLFNLYGPTETTVWSAAHRVEQLGDSVPIGRPIANTQIYILDRHLHPVPAGVPGEIFIGGEGVARGYLNRPELTAEKFLLLRNPFVGEPERGTSGPRESAERQERRDFKVDTNTRAGRPVLLYRTGDLGRWRANGEIEFLGRLDHQVKLRGHRIELGEVESVLGPHPAVREAAAVVREDNPGDARLVAYVVTAPDAKPNAADLRRFAQEKLPEAMMPSAFVFLDALPLTPNGKVNRKALPAPEARRPELETAYVAPRTVLERTIAGIWCELLHVEQVGLRDNFFDLGGHSLLVVQMQARLRDALGRDVPVVKLFQYPTISALANFLGEREPSTPEKIRDRGQRKRAVVLRHARREHEVVA